MLVVFIETQEQNNLSDVNSVSKPSLGILSCDFAIFTNFNCHDHVVKHNTVQGI